MGYLVKKNITDEIEFIIQNMETVFSSISIIKQKRFLKQGLTDISQL